MTKSQSEKLNEKLLSFIPKDATLVTESRFEKKLNLRLKIDPGFYYGLHKNGNLSFFAHAAKSEEHKDTRIDSLLRIAENFKGGYYEELMWAQRLYDGEMEDYSAWDDNSSPYKTTTTPEKWLIEMIQRVK